MAGESTAGRTGGGAGIQGAELRNQVLTSAADTQVGRRAGRRPCSEGGRSPAGPEQSSAEVATAELGAWSIGVAEGEGPWQPAVGACTPQRGVPVPGPGLWPSNLDPLSAHLRHSLPPASGIAPGCSLD